MWQRAREIEINYYEQSGPSCKCVSQKIVEQSEILAIRWRFWIMSTKKLRYICIAQRFSGMWLIEKSLSLSLSLVHIENVNNYNHNLLKMSEHTYVNGSCIDTADSRTNSETYNHFGASFYK